MIKDRIGTPITIGEITVFPLEKVTIYQVANEDGITLYFSKEPVGIAFVSPHKKWVVDITDGVEVPIESYYEKFDNLQQTLETL